MRTCFVYRAYDDHNNLLYIGCTYGVKKRIGEHKRYGRYEVERAEWVTYAVAWDIEEHPDRETALAVEALAICTERPLFNRGVPMHPDHDGCRVPPNSRHIQELRALKAAA